MVKIQHHSIFVTKLSNIQHSNCCQENVRHMNFGFRFLIIKGPGPILWPFLDFEIKLRDGCALLKCLCILSPSIWLSSSMFLNIFFLSCIPRLAFPLFKFCFRFLTRKIYLAVLILKCRQPIKTSSAQRVNPSSSSRLVRTLLQSQRSKKLIPRREFVVHIQFNAMRHRLFKIKHR